MKLDLLFRRRWWLIYGPVSLMSLGLMIISYSYWFPPAPRKLTIVSGQANDGYAQLAIRYKDRLEQLGIETDVINTEGAHRALTTLHQISQKPGYQPGTQMALVSGLRAPVKLATSLNQSLASSVPAEFVSSLQALAAVEREPVWIFTRKADVKNIAQIHNHRIGVASDDQLSQAVTKLILSLASPTPTTHEIVTVPRERLVNGLIDGKFDTLIILASVGNEAVKELLRSAPAHMVGVESISSIVSLEPRLRPFALPQGVIEFRGNVPPNDLNLLAADLHLLVEPSMHPALQRAILEVATELHEMPSFLQRQAEFPSVSQLNFKPTEVAQRNSHGYKPLIERVLPYGLAQSVEWLIFAFLPILLGTIFILSWIPSFLNWKTNALLQNFYGELKFLESEIDSVTGRPIEMKKLLQQIDAIEMRVMQLELPNNQSARWYTLREHLAHARDKLLGLRAR